MYKDVEELRRRWESSVKLAGGRYAEGVRMANMGGVECFKQSIIRHQKAIKKLRKMIKKNDERRA